MTELDADGHLSTGILAEIDRSLKVLEQALAKPQTGVRPVEVGVLTKVGHGIATARGLPGVQLEELLELEDGRIGLAFDLKPDQVGIVLLDDEAGLEAGQEVRRSRRVLDVPVGEWLIGRMVDALGRPLDGRGLGGSNERWPIQREAPSILERAPVTEPLQTGIRVVDALVPIGKGQRELIVGDRQTGKTAVALDTIINQRGRNVFCVYCAIGERSSAVAQVVSELKRHGAMQYCTVVAATGEDSPGLQYVAPYAATTIAEYFVKQGHDVLIVFDDLTRHARAYRELSLLLRRPPGREAFPGDIFYIHSRLLERAAKLKPRSGGSLTALPIVETEAQNISGYIPTNIISITDGQIYLSPLLFQKGILPAVDVGKSVSRVGGKAQLAAYRKVSGPLRLAYAQFAELETFSRFGTRIGEDTKAALDRGYRVREILKQRRFDSSDVAEQIIVLVALNHGVFDNVSLADIESAIQQVARVVIKDREDLVKHIIAGAELDQEDIDEIVSAAQGALIDSQLAGEDGNSGSTAA